MYINLNKQTMTLNVICGILEKYKPSKEIKDLHKKVNALKTQMDRFMKETVEPSLKDIEKLIDEENKKYVK
jgi:hypothetical protein